MKPEAFDSRHAASSRGGASGFGTSNLPPLKEGGQESSLPHHNLSVPLTDTLLNVVAEAANLPDLVLSGYVRPLACSAEYA